MRIGILCCGGKGEVEESESEKFPKTSKNLSAQSHKELKMLENQSSGSPKTSRSCIKLPDENKNNLSTTSVECLSVPEQLPRNLGANDVPDVSSSILAGLISLPNNHRSLFQGENQLQRSSTTDHLAEFKTHTGRGLNLPGSSPELYAGVSSYTQNMNNSPSKILKALWLGTKMDSINNAKLKKLGITHILSVTSGKQHKVPNCKLLSVPMKDDGSSDLKTVISKAFPFINESQQGDNRLLVHCNLGQNRSPTVVIAWLMYNQKRYRSLFNAYKFVKSKRALIQPHVSYVQQLRSIDQQINKIYSTPDDFLTVSYYGSTLNIAHEEMSADESSRYIMEQLDSMNTEQRETYMAHKQSNQSQDDSTYQSSSEHSKVVMPSIIAEDTEVVVPEVDFLTNGRKDGSTLAN